MDDKSKIKSHGLIELNHSQFAQAPEIYKKQLTDLWLDAVLATEVTDYAQIKDITDNLNNFGQIEQQAFWQLNNQLKSPLDKIIRDADIGEKIIQCLQQLQLTVLKIKPPKKSFFISFINSFKLLFSLKESAWHMWLEDYPIHKLKILNISEQLESYRKQLKLNNALLLSNMTALQNQMKLLESSFDVISHMEKSISDDSIHNQDLSSETRILIINELLPVMQRRLIEMQQQLLIARQSVMTIELFIRQNESQMRDIDQAVTTTTAAIDVTAHIFMIKQADALMKKNNNSATEKNPKINGTIDTKKLKQAQVLIDEALTRIKKIQNATDNEKIEAEVKNI